VRALGDDRADVVICGAGMAGLSLAVHLLALDGTPDALPEGARVLLVEPRTVYTHDRTWCFFDVVPHPFADAVAHAWPRWRIREGGRVVDRSAPGIRYVHVPGERFYAAARARIEASRGRVQLRLGTSVQEVADRGDHVEVCTSEGTLRAALCMDGRPPRLHEADGSRDARAGATMVAGARAGGREASSSGGDSRVRLLQHFGGRVVRCGRDIFDPEVATLMDFDVDRSRGLTFVYVLPFSRREALVESTYFTPATLPAEVYREDVDAYLRARHGNEIIFDTVAEEGGVIPMWDARFDVQPSARVTRIGLAGGFAKPSTGYAFLAVQRFSAAFAPIVSRAIRSGRPARAPTVRSPHTAAIDAVFLGFLASTPEQAPETFYRLFERVPAEVLVRFLSEISRPHEDLRVMAATRWTRMIAETLRTARRWLR
jgi:lycopene beta-cyclase